MKGLRQPVLSEHNSILNIQLLYLQEVRSILILLLCPWKTTKHIQETYLQNGTYQVRFFIQLFQPQNDFYSIIPRISPASQYNNLALGDTIKLFSLIISPIPDCANDIRLFENGVDPSSSDDGMNGGDFSNGFTIGGASQGL